MPPKKIHSEIIHHGFQADVIDADHFILGASIYSAAPVIMPGGHGWGAFKPAPEYQSRNGLDSMNCSNYGTHNSLETLAAFHAFDDFPKDCAERYSGVGTDTTPTGNSPHKVIEIIRTTIGVVPESELPFDDSVLTWVQYYSPKPMLERLLAIGRKILEIFDIGHDWVFTGGTIAEKQQKLKYALERGTVSLSVLAWKWHELEDGTRLYMKEIGEGDNHWVQLLDYVEGKSWHVYDHYDQLEKDLDWDYDFGFAKVYYLGRKVQTDQKKSEKSGIAQVIAALWLALIQSIKRALGVV